MGAPVASAAVERLGFDDDASSCRGELPGTLSQLALRSEGRAPGGRSPYAPDPRPPERLSPRQTWLLRGGDVLRARDVQPHDDGGCSALTCVVPFLVTVALPPMVIVRRPSVIVLGISIFPLRLATVTTPGA